MASDGSLRIPACKGIPPLGSTEVSFPSGVKPWPVLLPVIASIGAFATALPAAERISVSSAGTQGNFQSRYPTVSADGRYVAFESDATTLVAGDSNDATDVFVRDRVAGTTMRISVTPAGAQVAAASRRPSISGNGMRIVFDSFGALLPDSGFDNCYLVDRTAGTVLLLDRRADTGVASNSSCQSPSISVDGNRVAFASPNPFLVTGDPDSNGWADVFVRTLNTGATVRINRGPGGVEANAAADTLRIAAFGGHVAYASNASNLVAGDSNGVRDIFVSDGSASAAARSRPTARSARCRP
jgi:Tol biopolymer transport system component